MRVSIMARDFGLFMKYTIRMLFFIEALACAHEVQQLSTARCLQAPAQPYDTCLAFGTVGGRGLETVDAAKSTMPGRRCRVDDAVGGASFAAVVSLATAVFLNF